MGGKSHGAAAMYSSSRDEKYTMMLGFSVEKMCD